MAMFSSSISNPHIFFFILFMALTTTTTKTTSHARPLQGPIARHGASTERVFLTSPLIAHIGWDPTQVVEDDPTCWDSLLELSACTGEVVMFFLNGETYLGQSCCKAIEIIDGRCSPVLISTLLGYTTTERDVLEGYCSEEHESNDLKGRLRIESRSRAGVLHGGVLVSTPPN